MFQDVFLPVETRGMFFFCFSFLLFDSILFYFILFYFILSATTFTTYWTSNNQTLGSTFLCDVIWPCKNSAGMPDTRLKIYPFIHSDNQRCPIQSRLQSVLGVRVFFLCRTQLKWAGYPQQ